MPNDTAVDSRYGVRRCHSEGFIPPAEDPEDCDAVVLPSPLSEPGPSIIEVNLAIASARIPPSSTVGELKAVMLRSVVCITNTSLR